MTGIRSPRDGLGSKRRKTAIAPAKKATLIPIADVATNRDARALIVAQLHADSIKLGWIVRANPTVTILIFRALSARLLAAEQAYLPPKGSATRPKKIATIFSSLALIQMKNFFRTLECPVAIRRGDVTVSESALKVVSACFTSSQFSRAFKLGKVAVLSKRARWLVDTAKLFLSDRDEIRFRVR